MVFILIQKNNKLLYLASQSTTKPAFLLGYRLIGNISIIIFMQICDRKGQKFDLECKKILWKRRTKMKEQMLEKRDLEMDFVALIDVLNP